MAHAPTELQVFLRDHPDFELCDDARKVVFRTTGKKFDSGNVSVLRGFVAGSKYKRQAKMHQVQDSQVSISPPELVPVMVPKSVAPRIELIAPPLYHQQQISQQCDMNFESASQALRAVKKQMPENEWIKLWQQMRQMNDAKHVGLNEACAQESCESTMLSTSSLSSQGYGVKYAEDIRVESVATSSRQHAVDHTAEIQNCSAAPDRGTAVPNAVSKSLSDLEALILKYLESAPEGLTTLEIAKKCKLVTAKDVNPTLHGLQKKSLLVKIEKNGKPLWMQSFLKHKPKPSESSATKGYSMTPLDIDHGDVASDPAIQSSPNKAGTDTQSALESLILEVLNSAPDGLTPLQVAKRCKLKSATDVNPTLHALQSARLIVKTDTTGPDLWSLSLTGHKPKPSKSFINSSNSMALFDFDEEGTPVWKGQLPDTCNYDVINSVLRLASHVALWGIGEKTASKGFLIVVGAASRLLDGSLGGCSVLNKYDNAKYEILVQNFFQDETRTFVLPDFMMDKALVVCGQTGRILANSWAVHDISKGTSGAGTKTQAGSAIAQSNCFAIVCSEDSCGYDGLPRGDFKLFPGTKEPVAVHVKDDSGKYRQMFLKLIEEYGKEKIFEIAHGCNRQIAS
eukprot:gnl/MRDRNA2_/MRDRNA2_94079_c0_seq1.p1 gnl/MRDRNA2_/MRDRNA2_94079_c0~~gnl/MRDRNA2_/MRDRNA2_94079_c0_seq1.p1  ORF type:complete len:625 (-),score=127.62 gnl/MRDRNA2_/MRDRNA2_94079_c0_seq1:240-2114(-)